jgi:hypothetical protein
MKVLPVETSNQMVERRAISTREGMTDGSRTPSTTKKSMLSMPSIMVAM